MKEIIRIFRTMVLAVTLTVVLMNVIFINAYVPTGSMENTIMAGDRIFGIRLFHEYKRGDIIIFPDPDGEGIYLVKRIVGMPGDEISIEHGAVFVNGIWLKEKYIRESMEEEAPFTITLPEDGYFVMGDNRNESYDARYWDNQVVYGKDITGVVLLRYWPLMKVKYLR